MSNLQCEQGERSAISCTACPKRNALMGSAR
jgi:hypothetical protein